MKREIIAHSSLTAGFLLLVLLLKGWLNISYWPFLVGGIIGTILPDLDHLIHVFYLNPQEITSQRVVYLFKNKNMIGGVKLLFETRLERSRLIFHSLLFQGVCLVLAFFVLTSTGNVFGKGIVLAMFLHLLTDQLIDYVETKNISRWTEGTPFNLDNKQSIAFLVFGFVILIILSLLG